MSALLVEDVTTTHNVDYEIVNSTIVIIPGELFGTASLLIYDDNLIEFDEEFIVTIAVLTNNTNINPNMSSVTITIEDNDPG